MAVQFANLWHLGVLVKDLDAAMRDMTAHMGARWSTVLERDVPIEVGGSEESPPARVRWAFTLDAPNFELIEAGSGYWSLSGGQADPVHHLGYWSDDLDADRAALRGAGYVEEAIGRDDRGEVRFAYLRSPIGLRIELCADWGRPAWEKWMREGRYDIQFS